MAGTIPTDVVLFNIDSKSEVNGKQSKVAIVSVLQNVFNEMQGFSGSNPFLADLERKLTEEGKYDLFKKNLKIALVLLGKNHAATLISFRTML